MSTRVACTCVRKKCLGIFSIHAIIRKVLASCIIPNFSFFYRDDPFYNNIKSVTRVWLFVLRFSVFHLTLCDTHNICLHSSSHSLYQSFFFSLFCSLFLSLYLLPFSRFLVCTIWQCVLQILWIWLGTNNRVFSKKGTIFVKRNSLARDTLILFSAKHTDLYRVENIGDKGSIRRIFFLWPANFLFKIILIYLSKLFFTQTVYFRSRSCVVLF